MVLEHLSTLGISSHTAVTEIGFTVIIVILMLLNTLIKQRIKKLQPDSTESKPNPRTIRFRRTSHDHQELSDK